MKKICIVSTVGFVIDSFMAIHIRNLQKNHEVTLVIGNDDLVGIDVPIERINISRSIDIGKDLKSMYELYRYFQKNKFDLVLSLMPKAGLLSMMASCFAKSNVRIHYFTGQVWATKKGLFRSLLKRMDYLTVLCSTNILVDSESQKIFLLAEGILSPLKGDVLHEGSISGVNIEKFRFNNSLRELLRRKYEVSENEILFLYLGRINRDKGLLELREVFLKLEQNFSNVKLGIFGPLEDENIVDEIQELLEKDNVVGELSYCVNPQSVLNMADVFVMPSHREGFGTVVVEAASMGIPTIGSNIYGLSDSIIDNNTGLLHRVADIEDMFLKYSNLITNREKIRELGINAHKRVVKDFQDEFISKIFVTYIESKLYDKE